LRLRRKLTINVDKHLILYSSFIESDVLTPKGLEAEKLEPYSGREPGKV